MSKRQIMARAIRWVGDHGIKHLSRTQTKELCILLCDEMGLDYSEDNFAAIQEAFSIYFSIEQYPSFK